MHNLNYRQLNNFSLMTYEQIEKEFDEQFNNINIAIVTIESTEGTVSQQPAQDRVNSFLKQSFIKYLKDEVERLEKKIEDLKEYSMWNDFVRGQNEELEDQITYITNQIKELEA